MVFLSVSALTRFAHASRFSIFQHAMSPRPSFLNNHPTDSIQRYTRSFPSVISTDETGDIHGVLWWTWCDEDVGFFSFLRGCCHGSICITADLITPCGTGYHGSGLGMRTLHLRTFVARYPSIIHFTHIFLTCTYTSRDIFASSDYLLI